MFATELEIRSQPSVWRQALDLAADAGAPLAAPGDRVLAIGCGTSAFVAQSYALLREQAGFGETDAAYASELPLRRRYDRVVAFSRSGTTTEVLDALRSLPRVRCRVAVTAVSGQAVDSVTDEQVVLGFADETSVVQTRFPTAVLAFARAALGDDVAHLVDEATTAVTRPIPVDPANFDHYVYLAGGWPIGLAHEAALKVREAAQAWSESYPAMDYRHGPLAVAGTRTLVWAFGALPPDLATAIRESGATVHQDELDPLAQLVLAQRLALALAIRRGLDPDRPRLLTRSVVLAPT